METSNLELGNLIQGFKLTCQTEGKSPKTIDWYISFLNRFGLFLQQGGFSLDISDITKDHIKHFIRFLQTEPETLAKGRRCHLPQCRAMSVH
jgi:hypothetical protein